MIVPNNLDISILPPELNGLSGIDPEKGRIYLKKSPQGIEWIQPKGFFSKAYHYIFSHSMNEKDLLEIELKISQIVAESGNNEKNQIEIILEKIERIVINNLDTTRAKQFKLVNRPYSIPIIKEVARKIQLRIDGYLMTGTKDEVISVSEYRLIQEIKEHLNDKKLLIITKTLNVIQV